MFLSPEIILEGYNKGLFPMADSFNDPFVYWVDPKERGIIKLNEFKVSRSETTSYWFVVEQDDGELVDEKLLVLDLL